MFFSMIPELPKETTLQKPKNASVPASQNQKQNNGTRNHCPDVSQPVHFIIIIPRDRYIIRLYFNPLQHASSVNLSKRTCVYNTQLIRTLFNFQEPHTS